MDGWMVQPRRLRGTEPMRRCTTIVLALALVGPARAQEPDYAKLLGKKVLEPGQALTDLQRYVEPRLPPLPKAEDAERWQVEASRIRAEVLGRTVYRGAAAA